MPFGRGGGAGGGGGGGGGFNQSKIAPDAVLTFDIDLALLGIGLAEQSDMIDNSVLQRKSALVQLRIKTGTAPVAGEVYEIYALRGNGSGYRTDGAGATKAAIVIVNAPLIGTIEVTAALNTVFHGDFVTPENWPLGDEWGIAVLNATSQIANGTEGDHVKQYQTYLNAA